METPAIHGKTVVFLIADDTGQDWGIALMDWLFRFLVNDGTLADARLVQTAWSFRAMPSWWLLALLAILLVGSTVWFYRREKLSAFARWSLIACRTLLFGSIILLICRPTLEATLQSTRQRPIVVLLDNSLSMALSDPRSQASDKLRVALASQLVPPTQKIDATSSMSQVPDATPENLTRAEIVRLLLAHPELKFISKLQQQGPVLLKLFGQTVTGTQLSKKASGAGSVDGLNATETKTALGDALQSLLSAETEADLPAAIVIFSDGLEQGSLIAPEQAVQRAQRLNVPLHTIGIGAADWAYLQIKSLLVPDALFLNDTVTAQVHWRAQGVKALPLTMTLTLADVVVARKTLQGSNGEQLAEAITFAVPRTLVSDGPLDLRLTITGPALEDAPQPMVEWNQRVRVIDRQVRVLLIDHAPRFETKFLMSALLRDRRVEAHIHFSANDPAGMLKSPFEPNVPINRAELFHYDMIILGDVNPEVWGTEKLSWLRDLVRDGAGLVVLAGKRFTPAAYMKTSLAEAIPVDGPEAMPGFNDQLKTESYQPIVTPAGDRHEMLALADEAEENRKIWKELPGFYGAFPALKLRPGATSLLTHPTMKAGDVPLPLLALQRYGRGQVLYVGTDETWRWRANVGEKYFARFWGQVVYQLGLPRLLGGARRVQLNFDRTDQIVGQPSFLYARAYDQEYVPLTDARLQARLIPLDRTGKPSGEPPQPLPLDAIPGQPGNYRTLLSNDKTGRYLVTVDVPEPAALPYHVDYPPSDERIPAPMALERLKKLGESSGGSFSREENLHDLPGKIQPQEGSYQYRRDAVMWNPLPLVLMALLFSLELIIRKLTNLS